MASTSLNKNNRKIELVLFSRFHLPSCLWGDFLLHGRTTLLLYNEAVDCFPCFRPRSHFSVKTAAAQMKGSLAATLVSVTQCPVSLHTPISSSVLRVLILTLPHYLGTWEHEEAYCIVCYELVKNVTWLISGYSLLTPSSYPDRTLLGPPLFIKSDRKPC